ncbi:PKD-like family lipoprotein [Pedobacter sp.]|uniref:PKD-like family lipoprotein n=1 Tax=Pedobacter sp. TaxID=1411316 RepID=UPI003D7F656A
MKIYSFKFLTLILLMTGLMASCSKDKGNYTYEILDPLAINVTNIASTYSMLRYEYLDIKPVVTYKGEVVNPEKPQFPELSFSWEMYPSQAYGTIVERHTLANTPELHYQMTEKELTWEVLFTVTNTNTGVKSFAKFSAAITPALAEGWMVLYEKNGNTDVGIIANNEISKAATTEKLFLDLYANSNGAPLAGTPGSIVYSKSNFPTTVSLYVQSSKDIADVSTSTFQKISDVNKGIFWSKPASIAPSFMVTTEGRKDFLINNNKLHSVDYTIIATGDRAFGDALGGNHGALAPWLSVGPAAAFDVIAYDQTNKKFLKVAARGSELVPFATVQKDANFDVNNVGLELMFSDIGWNNWDYFVMKDNAANPVKYYMLSANFKGGEIAKIGQYKYDMSNCPEIGAINSMTTGYLGEIVYYSANNHLYQYKYTPGITDLLWTAPSGEKITNITLQKYSNTNRGLGALYDPKNLCKILYLATYNESSKIGTVYQMEVNPTSGAIIAGTEKKYTGFGKVKSMAWKLGVK